MFVKNGTNISYKSQPISYIAVRFKKMIFMIISTIHKFISIFAVLVIFNGCENEPAPKIKTNLDSETIKKTDWFSADRDGNQKVDNYQKSSLHFKNSKEYEIRKTFVYSKSTYRNPGIYEVQDSVIKLKSFDGSEHLGKIYVLEDNQLRIEWNKSTSLGDGTEIFVKKNE